MCHMGGLQNCLESRIERVCRSPLRFFGLFEICVPSHVEGKNI